MGISVNADGAFLLLSLGALAVMVEFIRPGLVAPGVAGASAMTLGGWAFWERGVAWREVHSLVWLGAGIPVVAAGAILLYFAWRARRNKTSCQ